MCIYVYYEFVFDNSGVKYTSKEEEIEMIIIIQTFFEIFFFFINFFCGVFIPEFRDKKLEKRIFFYLFFV